ncbi:putative type IX secretion system sortase PorU2 [Hymenobacter arcticus]
MDNYYPASWVRMLRGRALGLLLLLLALATTGAQAQSGAYGNEWIVQGQPYYKIKIWRDGLYRLDQAYLARLGAGAVAPTQLQVWRRGKEVAVYQGGNSATLDNSTFLEFYGQRNDGALDKELYKNLIDQANPYYSFYTDTAAYFVTWGSRAGKRMAQPVAAGGPLHGWRIQSSLVLKVANYAETNPSGDNIFLPWLEKGEGFFQGWYYFQTHAPLDSALRAVATSPGVPAPTLEALVAGGFSSAHRTNIQVIPPTAGGVARTLGAVAYNGFDYGRGRFAFLLSDIGSNGQVEVSFDLAPQPPQRFADVYRQSWWRVTAPQQNVWFTNRRQVFFQNDSLLSGPATYEVDNVPATVRGFDVEDPWNVQRVEPTAATTLGSTGRRYVFANATSQLARHLLLADEAQGVVPLPARRVTFRAIDPAKPSFIVITHPKLLQAAGTVPNVARAYANYRASAAGGAYDTLLVTTPQLYDQFHYGERSLMALRHFALWLAARSTATQSKYLLLLGKGIVPGAQVTATPVPDQAPDRRDGANAGYTARILGENGLDLVPISTRSPSDIFLSSDWPHDNFAPALPTGRVVATTPQEALVYLTKLQEYEAQINPNQLNPESWHKNIQHISGGHDITEIPAFRAHLDAYKRLAERPLFGGKVATTQRAYTGDALPVTVYIPTELNAGLALITYFGHGSTTEFDLNLGNINDPTTGYANAKKYPVMMYNGCSAGNAFTNSPTFATDWIFAANKGSIGMMAESGLSYEYLLNPAQDLTYRLLFNDPQWFGRPIAEVRREVVRRLVPSFAGNPQGTEQLLCTIWQGDPALRMYAPAKPDLVVSNATLSLSPIAPDAAISAASTQFTLNIGVSNPLRITRDSVEIRVTRSFPAPRPSITYVFSNQLNSLGQRIKPFPQAFQRDTTYTVVIPNPSTLDVSGDNKFTVELDYRNKIAELDETNNTATLNYSFLKRGITLLTPTEFAIIASNRPRLTAQSNDANGPVRSYDFQVDSVATFDSPGGLQTQTISAGIIASWTPPRALLAKRDSTVWYWRVRFTTPVGIEDAGWQVSSFRVLPTALSGGWSQSHNGQFNRDQLAGVTVAAPSNRWSFAAQKQALTLRTAGGGAPGSPFTFGVSGYGIATGSTVPDIITCAVSAPNLVLAVLDQYSLQRLVVPGAYSTCGPAGQMFYHFANDADTLDNLNNSALRRAQLLDFLSKVPDGSYVALVSANRLRFADPNVAATMRQVANLLGSKVVTGLKNGEPWALVAQKKAAGGLALAETGPDHSQPSPASQPIVLTYTLATPGQAGTITSTLIGPAQQWRTLFDVIRPETPTASYRLALVGYDASNNPTVLNPDIKTKNLDVSAYSATTYPYMQLQLALRDSVNRTPPQLKQWLLTYKGLPEGVVRRDLVATTKYDSTSLKNQAVINGFLTFPVKFDNISQEAFTGRLPVLVQLINVNTGLAVKTATLTAPRELPANDSVLTVNVRLDVTGTFGKFFVRVMVNPQGQPLGQPQGQPELYFFNNELRTDAFTVRDNNVPPTLDVAVDGRHILDGEIVSPSPVIAIQLKDEDRLRLIKDASFFTVFLQKNNEAPVPVDVNGTLVRFTVDNTAGSLARLEYQPGLNKLLDDGIYTLRVQGRDASNSSAGTQDYQVKFEVIQASKISNVYPYPNPVTSKAKFVFTVTGQELPRNMKIQIMTLTGRVVREIFMNELGPLHIGNNITDYAWDGTDQYGDRLANGTYLYRVAIDDPTGAYKKYTTAGDQAFKNDWGKLVLLR